MLILLLDTSLKGPLVGLADADVGRLMHHDIRSNPQEAAADLPRLIQGLLAKDHRAVADLGAVVVGTGPGSFTGIKIGLSFVYGWHRANPQLGLYACSALASLGRKSKAVDLWTLPATSTHGYFASSSEVGVLSLESGGIRLQGEGLPIKGLRDMGSLRVECLGAWPRFTEMALAEGIPVHVSSLEARGLEVLEALLQDFIANSGRLSDGLPRPRYLRKSAPEELADLQRT